MLSKTVQKLGVKLVSAKAKYEFPVDQLKNQSDVPRFAARLEQGAASAYLGAVPLFGNRDFAKAAASILGDEAMHWAIVRNATWRESGSGSVRQLIAMRALAVMLSLAAGMASAAGDPARGEQRYPRCLACHALGDERVRRIIADFSGDAPAAFRASTIRRRCGAPKSSGTCAASIGFLRIRQTVAGTTMTSAGVKDPQERADLIAYLAIATKLAGTREAKAAASAP